MVHHSGKGISVFLYPLRLSVLCCSCEWFNSMRITFVKNLRLPNVPSLLDRCGTKYNSPDNFQSKVHLANVKFHINPVGFEETCMIGHTDGQTQLIMHV